MRTQITTSVLPACRHPFASHTQAVSGTVTSATNEEGPRQFRLTRTHGSSQEVSRPASVHGPHAPRGSPVTRSRADRQRCDSRPQIWALGSGRHGVGVQQRGGSQQRDGSQQRGGSQHGSQHGLQHGSGSGGKGAQKHVGLVEQGGLLQGLIGRLNVPIIAIPPWTA